jgi:hypothetical protein
MYMRSPCCCTGQEDSAAPDIWTDASSGDREKRKADGEMEARSRRVSRQLSGESVVLHIVSIASWLCGREESISSEAK